MAYLCCGEHFCREACADDNAFLISMLRSKVFEVNVHGIHFIRCVIVCLQESSVIKCSERKVTRDRIVLDF